MTASRSGVVRVRAGCAVDAHRVWGPVEVSVRDGRIEHVEALPGGERGRDPADSREAAYEILGGDDYVLMPGWVNAHTHLSMTLLAGAGSDRPLASWLKDAIWPAEARMTAEDVKLGASLGIAASLLAGTTTVHDMYFFEEAVVQAAVELGIRAVLSVGLAGEGDSFRRKVERAADLADGVNTRGIGRVRAGLGPHAPYTCPPDSLRAVAEMARARSLPVHVHLSETRQEVLDAKAAYGLTPVALAESTGLLDGLVVAAHVVWPEAEDLDILARHGTAVAHCPTSNLWLGSGTAPISELRAKGVRVTLGTDGAASSPGLSMMEVARTAWLLAKGRGENPAWPTARDVLAWGTVEGARALGWTDVGLIEPAQRADLVLLRMDRPERLPLSDDPYLDVVGLLDSRDVDTVLVDGRVLVRGGKLTDVDLPALSAAVTARARDMRA